MNREDAESHWGYTVGIIRRIGNREHTEEVLELMGYLYIEAMLHGYKHGLQTLEETTI